MAGQTVCSIGRTACLGTGQFENLPDSTLADYAVRMQSGRECIGAPIFFFFELGTSHLTDTSQLVNLDELARVAKKYGLKVKVTGAADSATGTVGINNALSVSRADYIASEQAGITVRQVDQDRRRRYLRLRPYGGQPAYQSGTVFP